MTSTAPALIKPELGSVQETLLIPVYARARETQRADGLFSDPASIRMMEQIDYDFTRFDSAANVLMDVVTRTELLDGLVRDFLARFPTGQIINLGAGLDTRRDRLDNGQMHWVDLDMPDSIELRSQFFVAGDRFRTISRSMFDQAWTDELFPVAGEETLILAEGLLPYFEPPQVASLFQMLAGRFPGGSFVFQSVSPPYVGKRRAPPGVRETSASFGWGIDHGREVERFDPRVRHEQDWFLIDRHRPRWGRLRWLTMLPLVRGHVRRCMKFTGVRFLAQ